MTNLPNTWVSSGSERDRNNWGAVLNEYLRVEHNADGTHGNITSLTATTGAFDTIKLDRTNLDVILVRDAAYTAALRNSTNAMLLNLYGTYTSSSEYERLKLGFDGGAFSVVAEQAGSGTNRSIRLDGASLVFRIAGVDKWAVQGDSSLAPQSDNSIDFGTSLLRPQTGRFGTSVEIADHAAYAGRTAYKSADETLNTSTTVQNDDELSVTVIAGETYAFKFWIWTNNASATEGAKFALGGTCTATTLKAVVQIVDDTLDSTAAISRISALGTEVSAALSSGNNLVMIAGTIEVNAGGTFLLQWAQAVSGANNLTIQQGSYLSAERVA
jgi:hypothetical protein